MKLNEFVDRLYAMGTIETSALNESYHSDDFRNLCREYSSLYPYDISLREVWSEIVRNYEDEDLANDVVDYLEGAFDDEEEYDDEYLESLTEDKDLSTVKGSMTQILQDNKDKIDSCITPQEVHDTVAGLLSEANLDTPATRRLLMKLNKQRNIVGALQVVYNSILKGSDLGVIK